jgi:hypothetical protein
MTYIDPKTQKTQFPKGISLGRFLQTVFVGVSGLPQTLVRPKWQTEPPQQPDLTVDWMALGLETSTPDAGAYVALDQSGNTNTLRHEQLDVSLSIYGPNSLETYGIIRDSFQIPTNRIALFLANMGFVELQQGRRIPDLANQRWVERVETIAVFRRQVQRVYPVLSFVSASGIIYLPDVAPGYEDTFEINQ